MQSTLGFGNGLLPEPCIRDKARQRAEIRRSTDRGQIILSVFELKPNVGLIRQHA
jgi:hypothetical protein